MFTNTSGTTTHNSNGVVFTSGSRNAVESHAAEVKHLNHDTSELFSDAYFRTLITRFFLTFTNDDGRNFLYKDLMLNLVDHDSMADQMQGDLDGNSLPNSNICAFSLDLKHIKKSHQWDVEGCSSSMTDTGSESSRQSDNNRIFDCDVLYQCFRAQPMRFVPLAENVVKNCFKILTNKVLTLFQLELADDTIIAKNIRMLNATEHMDRLVLVPGIVVSTNRSMMKGAHVTARCKSCGHVLSIKLPNWKGDASLPSTCSAKEPGQNVAVNLEDRCPMNPYEVLSEFTTFVEVQNIKLQERPEDIPVGDIPRSITTSLCGVHVRTLKPGNRKYIMGVFTNFSFGGAGRPNQRGRGSSDSRTSMIHCLGIFNDVEEGGSTDVDQDREFSTQEVNQFKQFSKRPDLLDVVTNSIAPSICGHDDVKKSIACMLFGGTEKAMTSGNRSRSDIHILLLGDPSVAKSQFLKYACKVSPQGVYTSGKGSSAAGLTAAIVKDIQGNFALEGGAMVLADGGIVCIDEFDKMRDDDRVAIHEAMEQQTISIAKAGITTVLGTKCSVLSAANPAFGSFDFSKDTSEQHDFETTILSRFDLIWLIKDEKDYNRDRKIANHIFDLFVSSDRDARQRRSDKFVLKDSENRDIMSTEFLKRYLKYARKNVAPRLTDSGANRLENYYIEVRDQCRNSTQRRVDQIPITVRQLESLVRLSESLAKMHLNDHVQPEHVEEAMRLFNDATVASSHSAHIGEALTDEEKLMVTNTEEAILRRVAIHDRISKYTIAKDLQNNGYLSKWIHYAINVLVRKGHFKETRESNVIRIV
eukprot:GHVH01004246.1.p1 GENE.GHVH01004246.1~~GHVH01004246.1.p1  ORF type:complete len:811 (+),score=102.58 GHVH01004246.1:144-2576(+)